MSEYRISWTSFKNNLCNGFSQLQQKEEFVDMTLAADGHFVRVHRNIMSVASPYIKEILQSTTCRDPVVFLNNVSSYVLSYILEYIYTGEVNVPKHTLNTFIKAAKSLHITGIKDLVAPMMPQELNQPLSGNSTRMFGRLAESTTAVEKHSSMQSYADKNMNTGENEENQPMIKDANTSKLQDMDPQRHCNSINSDDNNIGDVNSDQMDVDMSHLETTKEYPHTSKQKFKEKSLLDKAMENIEVVNANEADQNVLYKANIILNYDDHGGVMLQNDEECRAPKFNLDNENEYPAINISVNRNTQRPESVPDSLTKVNTEAKIHDASAPIYSISKRGSLQLILNRFVYNMHHSSNRNKKRRWRCVDYRKLNCKAYIDTSCDQIVERKKEHNHEFHDAKIFKKGSAQNIYSTIEDAESAAKLEDALGV